MRRTSLVVFALMQATAFMATLLVVSRWQSGRPAWPLIIVFGLVLAQCSLAAGFAAFGPWRFSLRMICSGLIVACGGATIVASANAWHYRDLFGIGFFAILMWIAIQIPLWLCRFFLRARLQVRSSATISLIQSQYGIRQLIGLTLFVSVICGLARLIFPTGFVEELKTTNWIGFTVFAAAIGLLLSTIAIATLNAHYFRAGLAISAGSAVLIAYGVRSAFELLNIGPPSERIYFAFMLLCTYAWLQLSALMIRPTGCRIVVGS
jgi:hypothetical protein